MGNDLNGVGWFVGCAVGCAVGCEVGSFEGLLLPLSVGVSVIVGAGTGSCDGAGTGSCDGAGIGSCDGAGPATVGAAVETIICTSSIATSLRYPVPVVAEKRTWEVLGSKGTVASYHPVPWLPLSVHFVVHSVPPSTEISKFSVPMFTPNIEYQKFTLDGKLTALSSRKGPTYGLFPVASTYYLWYYQASGVDERTTRGSRTRRGTEKRATQFDASFSPCNIHRLTCGLHWGLCLSSAYYPTVATRRIHRYFGSCSKCQSHRSCSLLAAGTWSAERLGLGSAERSGVGCGSAERLGSAERSGGGWLGYGSELECRYSPDRVRSRRWPGRRGLSSSRNLRMLGFS